MYPHTQETEFKCIRWRHDLWTVCTNPKRSGISKFCLKLEFGALIANVKRGSIEVAFVTREAKAVGAGSV